MRRRLFLTALGIIGFIVLVIGIGAASVSRKEYLGFIEESVRNKAAEHGVRIATRNFDVFPFGIKASEVDTYLVRYLLTVTIGDATAEVSDLTPSIAFSGRAYGGTIGGNIARPWFSEELTAHGKLSSISLTQHPQLNALGVSGGTLSLTVLEAAFDNATQRIRRARFEGSIGGFARATPLTVRPGQFGSPFGFTVPPIPPTDIEVAGSVDNGRLALSRVGIATVLGTISASGEVPLEGNGELAIDALLSLSPEGVATVGPYLPLVSEGAVDAQATKVRLVARGSLQAPRLKWSRAG